MTRDDEGMMDPPRGGGASPELLGYAVAEVERILHALPDDAARMRVLRSVSIVMFDADLLRAREGERREARR